VETQGAAGRVIGQYLSSANQEGRVDLRGRPAGAGTGGAVFEWAELRNAAGELCQDFSIGDRVVVTFGLRLAPDRPRTKLAVNIRASDGTPVAHAVDDDSGFALGNDHGSWALDVNFDDIRLYPGSYRVTLWAVNAANTEVFDHAEDCLTIRMVDGGRLTMRPLPRHWGIIFLTPGWTGRPELPAAAATPQPKPPTGEESSAGGVHLG
jgi:lipopolysaccharide transport system ATP-binding protein